MHIPAAIVNILSVLRDMIFPTCHLNYANMCSEIKQFSVHISSYADIA